MPQAYNKFNCFVENQAEKVHDLGVDTLKLLLTNTVPNAADTVVDTVVSPATIKATSNSVSLATGGGYTDGGAVVTVTTSAQSGGTYTLAANQVSWTAVGATIGPFQYAVLYNSSGGAAATRPVIGWWAAAAPITLQIGDTFTHKFNSASPGTILTVT